MSTITIPRDKIRCKEGETTFTCVAKKTPFTTLFPMALSTIAIHMILLFFTLLFNGLPNVPDWLSSIPALIEYLHLIGVVVVVSVEIWTDGLRFGGQRGLKLMLTVFIIYMVTVSTHAQLHIAVARAEPDSYIFLSREMSPWLRYYRSFYLTFDVMGGLGTGSVVAISDISRAVIISNILFQNLLNIYVLGNVIDIAVQRSDEEKEKKAE